MFVCKIESQVTKCSFLLLLFNAGLLNCTIYYCKYGQEYWKLSNRMDVVLMYIVGILNWKWLNLFVLQCTVQCSI